MSAFNDTTSFTMVRPIRISMRARRCSFCRDPRHTVNICTSPLIVEFQNLLYQKKNEINQRSNVNLNVKISHFESWLYSLDDINLLKVYAVRNCGAYTREPYPIWVVKITNYIWFEERYNMNGDINEERREYQTGFQTMITQFNDLANVLIQNQTPPEETLEGIMSWIIDRTPDYTILDDLMNSKKLQKITIQIKEENEENKNVVLKECCICYEQREHSDTVKLNCYHEFCGLCVKKIIDTNRENRSYSSCAYCRELISNIEVKNEEMEKMFLF